MLCSHITDPASVSQLLAGFIQGLYCVNSGNGGNVMSGETIFMIHGMMGGSWCWDNYRSFFTEQGYHCVTPVLRYHDIDPRAVPDPQLGTTGLLDYAADLEEEIRRLDTVPVIMGHSMGGLLAQILGSRGLARALVLLTPAAPHGIHCVSYTVVRSFAGLLLRYNSWKKPFRISFGQAVYAMLHLLPPAEQKKVYDRLVWESGRAAFQIGFWFLDRQKASRVDHARVKCPVLVVGAGQDRITPAAVVQKVAAKYGPVATYREYANHAHWILSGPGWREIAADTAAWLEEVL